MTKKILTVYGTRPEAIKIAPVIKALNADDRFHSITVSTGQHREMLDQVNEMFDITPDFDLEIMKPGQTLNDIVSRVIQDLDAILESERPDAIIVHGDTSTAMAAAISAFNRETKVVHVEAGLRTGNLYSPFPEEANRRLISQVAALHLAPTAESRSNLIRENFDSAKIVVTGNTVTDALVEAAGWETSLSDVRLRDAHASGRRIVLVTTHRRENLDAMSAIGKALGRLAQDFQDSIFILPAHLNPRVRDAVLPHITHFDNVIITEPLPYDEFTKLMACSTLILTDSGGIQEEAPSLGKPVLVMRENTERPEAVSAGTVRLVGTDEQRIVQETTKLLTDQSVYEQMSNAVNPYGDGNASSRCVSAIAEMLGIGTREPDFAPLD